MEITQSEKNKLKRPKEKKLIKENMVNGNSLAVQWLGLCTLTAEGPGLIPGQGGKKGKKAK